MKQTEVEEQLRSLADSDKSQLLCPELGQVTVALDLQHSWERKTLPVLSPAPTVGPQPQALPRFFLSKHRFGCEATDHRPATSCTEHNRCIARYESTGRFAVSWKGSGCRRRGGQSAAQELLSPRSSLHGALHTTWR